MNLLYVSLLSLPLLLTQCNSKNNQELIAHHKDYILNDQSPTLSGDNAMYHAKKLVDMGDRSSESEGFQRQLTYIEQYLKKCGWVPKTQPFEAETPIKKARFCNLRARFGNSINWQKAPEAIVSCHMDTKKGIPGFVGANDGASGVALILELARELKKYPDLAKKIEFVFFDGEESFEPHMNEEDGLYGSKYYTNSLQNQLPQYLINLDMVGRQGMKIKVPSNTPQKMYEVYQKGIKHLGFNKSRWGVAWGPILDDHVPFQERDVEVINIIDDFSDGSWWHTKDDNFNILCGDSMKECGQMTIYMLESLLNHH